jgi:uncharacterized Zn finger protein
MAQLNYFCTGCSFKTTNISNLVKKGGCRSCGKSGAKCPNCGMPLKQTKALTATVSSKPVQNQQVLFKKIETGQSGRKINVKKI